MVENTPIQQREAEEDLQYRLTEAFAHLRKDHPIIDQQIFKAYLKGHGIEEYHLFAPQSFSSYLEKNEPILRQFLDKEQLDYFKQQLKHFKASLIIMTMLAEDPLIMNNEKNDSLLKLLEECLEQTAKAREMLSEEISEKINLPQLQESKYNKKKHR